MCGGSPPRPFLGGVLLGLSPRVRGKRFGGVEMHPAGRSIPACAGEACTAGPGARWVTVYPRVCGGSAGGGGHISGLPGLSPRVRGKRVTSHWPPPTWRSIPACAGEAPSTCRRRWRTAVYPRVCGGSPVNLPEAVADGGLSPRVRGKPAPPGPTPSPVRSIPACAGEAGGVERSNRRPAVYPRVCGGSHILPVHMAVDAGLSPRVRGKRTETRRSIPGGRSIPACAGEAQSPASSYLPPGVYPRVCGGSAHGQFGLGGAGGLSPRVRGKRSGRGRWCRGRRSIPACAGEATHTCTNSRDVTVYPRVCGGSVNKRHLDDLAEGLSPRVRGKQ